MIKIKNAECPRKHTENSNNTSGVMTAKKDSSGVLQSEIVVKYYYNKEAKQNIYNITNNYTTGSEVQPITYIITDGSTGTTTSTQSVGKTDTSTSSTTSSSVPKTGDMEVVIAIGTIVLVIAANVIQIVVSKKRKKQK